MKTMTKDSFDFSPKIEDYEEGPVSPLHDAMIASHNQHRDFINRSVKRGKHYMSPDCFGVKTFKSEYIGDLLGGSNGFNATMSNWSKAPQDI